MGEQLGELLAALRRRLHRPGAMEPVMLGLGAATGFGTGVVVWLLISGIELVQRVAWSPDVPAWQIVVVPTMGGLLVGLLVWKVVPESSGGGVVPTMESLAIRGGQLSRRIPLAGTAATSLALGTGASGGREGPIVLIGGAIGSAVGRGVRLDDDRMRSLVAAGAAAGIGATFNAPIGGMLFAIELLLGGIRRAGSLQVVVVASVVSAVTARQLVGESLPLFQASSGLGLGAPAELLLYAGLGLAAVVVAFGFRRGEDVARRRFARVRSRIGVPFTVALGGLGVGLVALVFPEVLGEGSHLPGIDGFREPIQAMLDGGFGTSWTAAGLLLALAGAKLLATLFAVGSGSAVGTFAPTLFTGAALGAAFGIVAAQFLGADLVQSGAFALVGMAAVYAATARAPLTAILIVFELTGSYDLVLPLMLAVGIAMFVTELLGWDSLYLHQLRQRGVVYGQIDELDVLQTVTVGEVMSAPEGHVVPATTSADALRAHFASSGSHGVSVVDERGRLVGVVSRSDLARPGTTAQDLATRKVLTVTAQDPVFRAVRRMASLDVGRLPVVDPLTREVVGVLRRGDVVRAYQRGIARSLGAQQRAASGRLRDLAGVGFVEVVLQPGSALTGRAVREVAWPERSVLTSVRRNGEVVVPTGDTLLQDGDELVVLTGRSDELRELAAPEQAQSRGVSE
ncbi:chloride channel protein [Egicoccus sp. AB-alg2]|uniref:chloride channel protein n=1 Tax=Egicoccus sp. AB-alg2 TaxID=3242693 RepID=UPI00359DD3E1